MRALLLVSMLLAGCGEDESYIVVKVDKRPAVHDAVSLKVTVSNGGAMYSQDLAIDEHVFPLTFSVSAPGRSGDLGLSIDAFNLDAVLVGRGTATAKVDDLDASLLLDSADFVVNTEFAMDQYLSTDYEAVGFQLAAITDGTWTTTFRDECTECNVYARRFNSSGLPVFSMAAAGDIGFKVNSNPTTNAAMSAAASSGLTTLLFWDFTENTGGARGVACRSLSETGAANAQQLSISTDAADVVSATGLSNGNFAVVWQVFQATTYVIRTAIVKADCTAYVPAKTANMDTSLSAQRPHVAANGNNVLYAWIVAGGLKLRASSLDAVFSGAEASVIPKTPSMDVEHVRVAPWGSGFAVAIRWASNQTDAPGKIELYRVSASGQLQGNPVLITDKSRSDFASNKGFSLARRSDDALLVVWHVCEAGPGLCDVFGRILRPTGAQVGDEFLIPTSTASEQINPSVVAIGESFVAAWNDSSGEAPDRSGTAVRARVVYPVYDDAKGVHGAACGASATANSPPCGEGLACALGSDGAQRCYVTCTPPSCPGGGTCSMIDELTSACTF
jgi:hypothetical protein